MAMTSGELERKFIETAAEKTGKTLSQWLTLVKSSGIGKRNDILEWLKKTHGLGHLEAQFVAGIHLNAGQPVYSNETGLLEQHFAKCPVMRPVFDSISAKILSSFHGTQLIPKKTYLSFTAVREFAAVNIKPAEIRLGLDLGETPFTAFVQRSKLTGPMPRFTHMLALNDPGQLDDHAMSFITLSYNRTHKK